ncbi:uncharacterized protein [Antennarius striatus]|uniref:uncharacterized protein n=1 Tax=Antennarius striatus TaxID=241820 RepID=UPI0035AEC607
MLLHRRVCAGIPFVLLIFGDIANVLSLYETTAGLDLDCTNDLDQLMSCDLEAQNCTEYKVNIRSNDGYGEVVCIFQQCDSGRCCCSTYMTLIHGETHTATLWKRSENMGSKIINVAQSFKPRTPTITSVEEINGNFHVKWKSNMNDTVNDYLIAQLSYYKKGDTNKIVKSEKPTLVDGLYSLEIPGRNLSRNTIYLVSVKSYSSLSPRFSDSSEERQFKTSLSSDIILSAIITIVCFAAAITGGILYCCYVKAKAKWWDIIADSPNHKLLDMHPSVPQILKPALPVISSVSVESCVSHESKPWRKESLSNSYSGDSGQSSEIQTNSSSQSYATTEPADIIAGVQEALGKAFANISPISPLTTNQLIELNKHSSLFSSPFTLCDVRADDLKSGLYDIDNKTYSSFSIPHQSMAYRSHVQTPAEMLCDSAYHPSQGDSYQPVPTCPLVNFQTAASAPLPTDMFYQQCNGGPGRFSNIEDSHLSPISSDANKPEPSDSVSRGETGCDNSDWVAGGAGQPNVKTETTVTDENSCCNLVPAGSQCFSPVDDAYKPFLNLVKKPDVLFSEKRSGEEETHFNKPTEGFITRMPQTSFSSVPGITNNVQHNQQNHHLQLQRPFPVLMTVDSNYKIL